MTTDELLAPIKFKCGCIWSNRGYYWLRQCSKHFHFDKADPTTIEGCYCLNFGQDDGAVTCFPHHDCSDGSCTHQIE